MRIQTDEAREKLDALVPVWLEELGEGFIFKSDSIFAVLPNGREYKIIEFGEGRKKRHYSRYAYDPTGKLTASIRHHWKVVKTYRERKDGTWNPAIFEEVRTRAARKISSDDYTAKKKGAKEFVEKTLKQAGIPRYSSRISTVDNSTQHKVAVSFQLPLDKLGQLLSMLDELGVDWKS
jgi:hypothetical protein